MKYKITLKGRTYEIEVEQGEAMIVDDYAAGAAAMHAPPAPAMTPASASAPTVEGNPVTAPLPGNILSVNVNMGESIKAGQVLVIIEAMKMENEIPAPCDGIVKQIITSKGAVVATGDTLLVI